MELIDIVPEFNIYDSSWKTYTKTSGFEPVFYCKESKVETCIVGEGSEICGEIKNSVLGTNVIIEKGAVVEDSIIMSNTVVGGNTKIHKAIIAENCVVGSNCNIGVGEEAESKLNPNIYNSGLTTMGQGSVIPDGVTIGKNTAILGKTTIQDYIKKELPSGGFIIKAGGHK